MGIPRTVGLLAAATATAGLLAGCGTTTSTGPATAAPPASSAAGAGVPQEHNQADVTFLQDMIPHHAQAITISQLAPSKADSPQVKDLAARIQAAQGPEIQQMIGILTAWGILVPPTTGDMNGMDHGGGGHQMMPGMQSDQAMQQLAATSGAAFDQMFLRMMTAHHEGAVGMAQTELTQGANPATRRLAQDIITAQQAEIAEMQTLLQRS